MLDEKLEQCLSGWRQLTEDLNYLPPFQRERARIELEFQNSEKTPYEAAEEYTLELWYAWVYALAGVSYDSPEFIESMCDPLLILAVEAGALKIPHLVHKDFDLEVAAGVWREDLDEAISQIRREAWAAITDPESSELALRWADIKKWLREPNLHDGQLGKVDTSENSVAFVKNLESLTEEKRIGLRLKSARKNKGYTQAYAAELIGIEVSTLQSHEYGRRSVPDSYTRNKYASVYEVDISQLFR